MLTRGGRGLCLCVRLIENMTMGRNAVGYLVESTHGMYARTDRTLYESAVFSLTSARLSSVLTRGPSGY